MYVWKWKMLLLSNALPFLKESRYRPNYSYDLLFLIVVYSSVYLVFSYHSKCKDLQCVNGECINGTCICYDGWQGPLCQYCGGKIKWVHVPSCFSISLWAFIKNSFNFPISEFPINRDIFTTVSETIALISNVVGWLM